MKISIPQPCHENWQEMTPNEQGRSCASCQKTVVDFTTWPDEAIFNFFMLNQAKTCGRFTSTQLNKVLSPQPKRQRHVYPIAFALAVASLFAQPPVVHAQQVTTHQTSAGKKVRANQHPHLSLQGTVTGKNDQPLANVSVKLLDYRLKPIAHATMDAAGRYSMANLNPDTYSIEITPVDTLYASHSDPILLRDTNTIVNINLMLKSDQDNYIIGDVDTGVPEMQVKEK